jgi:hypothetical protein
MIPHLRNVPGKTQDIIIYYNNNDELRASATSENNTC